MSVPPVTLGDRATPSPAVTFLDCLALPCDTPPGLKSLTLSSCFGRTSPWLDANEDPTPRVTASRCLFVYRASTSRSIERTPQLRAYRSPTTWPFNSLERETSTSRPTCTGRETKGSRRWQSLPEGPLDSEKPPNSLPARGALISVAQPESCCSMSVPDSESGAAQLGLRVSCRSRLPRRGEGVR
jgi:hypothetical protein